MTYCRVLGWSAVAVLATAVPAFAQETRRFDIGLTARATYDTNVPRSNVVVANQRGLELEDIVFSPVLTVDILHPIGRQSVFLNGLAGYNFYRENDQLNREQVALRGGLNSNLGFCSTTVGGEFNRQQSELEDLSPTITENVETLTSAKFDATCGRPVGLGATLGLTQQWAENSASQRQEADYQRFSAMVGLVYQRPTLGTITVFGRYGKTEYENRMVPRPSGGVEEDGYELYGAGLSYARRLGARIQGSVSVGYSAVEPTTENGDDFQGTTYEASLTFRPSSRIEGTVAFSRAVEPSNRLQTSYAIEDTYLAQVDYKIGSRLNFQLGGSYGDRSYERAPNANPFVITDEQVKTVFSSLRFSFSERLSLALEASQEERDANVHGFDYTSNRVGVSVVGTY